MQWTHPELFWALLLLVIPLLIHLFEWRRFRKFFFTNLKLLQEVQESSRKSKTLKKWLLLLSRSLALLALVLAFVQPFTKKETGTDANSTLSIYLDNSFSMQARKGGVSLLEDARQALLRNIPANTPVNLLTNDRFLKGITRERLQTELLEIGFSQEQLDWKEISAALSFNEKKEDNYLIISDFQGWIKDIPMVNPQGKGLFFWPLKPDLQFNSYIDTLMVRSTGSNVKGVDIQLKSAVDTRIDIQVKINGEAYSNTSVTTDSTGQGILKLQLPDQNLDGMVEIRDPSIAYDNRLYFSLSEPEKTRVLGISDTGEDFLSRLFDFPEFVYMETLWSDFQYGTVGQYDWLVLNEVRAFPSNFIKLLARFLESGGGVLIVPAADADPESYNQLLTGYGLRLGNWNAGIEQEVSSINYDHPIFRDVFYKRAARFDYPKVEGFFELFANKSPALSFSDGKPFLVAGERMVVFSAPLNHINSDFQSSPLIVPSIQNSIRREGPEKPYYQIGEPVQLRLPLSTSNDKVVRLSSADNEWIPAQSRYENYTEIELADLPGEAGIHYLKYEKDTLRSIAFNRDRSESIMDYAELSSATGIRVLSTIDEFFDAYLSDRNGQSYWQWLLWGALFFLLAEWLIQKLIP